MNESRLKHFDKRRPPKQKRTIRIFGAVAYDQNGRAIKDQSDKIIRCWNCGMICNEQHPNVKLGDGVGYTIQDAAEPVDLDTNASSIAYPMESGLNAVTIRLMNPCIRMMKTDSGGDPVTVIYNQSQIVKEGCPLCGTMAYR